MQLTQKETQLLKDLKDQEKLCADKYTRNAAQANDPQLKNIFTHLAETEMGHYNTITKIENGEAPQPGGGSGSSTQSTVTAVYDIADTDAKKNDCFLASDLLAAEKHASHLYDTCIFEFKDENTRNVLNHIQKEEQQHGKILYDYMSKNGMYS